MAFARAEAALVTAITALCLSVRTACPDIYKKGTPNTRGDVLSDVYIQISWREVQFGLLQLY